ncbi:hypothetical protein SLEP1_g36070 [Rubroshorea leprosula]|uniref:Uncharacterized protein n=1 Tax=Rubroshorea leprosula TaxID=152421 RepID=A0AAV5KQN9_9ROSI|nr:hypothetical protein SLEP1_g36070 [Rubroshorea leprosula]
MQQLCQIVLLPEFSIIFIVPFWSLLLSRGVWDAYSTLLNAWIGPI